MTISMGGKIIREFCENTIITVSILYIKLFILKASLVCRCGCIILDWEVWFIKWKRSVMILARTPPVAGNLWFFPFMILNRKSDSDGKFSFLVIIYP